MATVWAARGWNSTVLDGHLMSVLDLHWICQWCLVHLKAFWQLVIFIHYNLTFGHSIWPAAQSVQHFERVLLKQRERDQKGPETGSEAAVVGGHKVCPPPFFQLHTHTYIPFIQYIRTVLHTYHHNHDTQTQTHILLFFFLHFTSSCASYYTLLCFLLCRWKYFTMTCYY